MSIKQFQQELSKELASRVYMLYSSDNFLLYEALSSIKTMYMDAGAFNFDVFNIKSPDNNKPIQEIIDILNTLPFLSERRVVVIENIQKLLKKDLSKLESYLINPSNTSLLVMLHKGQPPKLFNVPIKNIKVIALNMQDRDLPLWIKDKARQKGIELADRAVEWLISCVGTDLGMLHSEIEKISSLYIKQKNHHAIDINDIKELVYAGVEYSVFDLVNALRKGNAKEVFKMYESVSRNTEPQMLLGAINWQYAKFQSKEKRYYEEIFGLLHKADASIKTSHSFTIEDLLVKLLNK